MKEKTKLTIGQALIFLEPVTEVFQMSLCIIFALIVILLASPIIVMFGSLYGFVKILNWFYSCKDLAQKNK